MAGTLYGIGVGPGDPDYLTLKAIKCMEKVDIIAAPGKVVEETTAYKIAVQAAPFIEEKEKAPIFMPMVMDRAKMEDAHRDGAAAVIKLLEEGKDVGFLTLGDTTIYSTFSYIEKIVKEGGYNTVYISGIPSFCAAAAEVGVPLCEWTEPLHVIPAVHKLDEKLPPDGNYVLMKSGSKMAQVKEILRESRDNVFMVENCGMPDQKVYHSIDEIPDDAGYFSLIIAK